MYVCHGVFKWGHVFEWGGGMWGTCPTQTYAPSPKTTMFFSGGGGTRNQMESLVASFVYLHYLDDTIFNPESVLDF